MIIFITCDAHWEARVSPVIDDLQSLDYLNFFGERYFGPGLRKLSIILNCHDVAYKQRVSLSKKELSFDIMLDFQFMKSSPAVERRLVIAQKLYDDVPEVISRYRIKEFDAAGFISDWRIWLVGTGWLDRSAAPPVNYR